MDNKPKSKMTFVVIIMGVLTALVSVLFFFDDLIGKAVFWRKKK